MTMSPARRAAPCGHQQHARRRAAAAAAAGGGADRRRTRMMMYATGQQTTVQLRCAADCRRVPPWPATRAGCGDEHTAIPKGTVGVPWAVSPCGAPDVRCGYPRRSAAALGRRGRCCWACSAALASCRRQRRKRTRTTPTAAARSRGKRSRSARPQPTVRPLPSWHSVQRGLGCAGGAARTAKRKAKATATPKHKKAQAAIGSGNKKADW